MRLYFNFYYCFIQAVRQSRKRKRNPHLHKRNILKRLVEQGKEHQTRSRKIIAAKTFIPQPNCKCRLKCSDKIPTVHQKEIYDFFYSKSSWTQKTLFIRANVQRHLVKKKKSQGNPIIPIKNRQFCTTYTLPDKDGLSTKVCRTFFQKCLNVTESRIARALDSKTKNPTACEKRGCGPPANKTPIQSKNEVMNFISQLPSYESHYGRTKTSRKYLHPHLNLSILYREYRKMSTDKNLIPVSDHIFRDIFNHEFNLSFKRRKTDSCKTCDEIMIGINSVVTTQTRKNDLIKMKAIHETMYQSTNDAFVADVQLSQQIGSDMIVLVFDLQKTLPTPLLSTSVAYYKRQLWTYNLCIYNETDKCSNMYVWSENVASRGAQEIGSCLINYMRHNLKPHIKKVVLYSDACGGQNRNIKMALMLKSFLHGIDNKNIISIEQRFFVSGHSYNACDRCFGLIEKMTKTVPEDKPISVPNDWVNLIANAKISAPKFEVKLMESKDFYSTSVLESEIVNRKKDESGVKFSWLDIRKILYEIDHTFTLFVCVSDSTVHPVNIKKRSVTDRLFSNCELPLMYPFGNQISKEKKKDLLYLLKYIDKKHHNFYKQLSCVEDEVDEDFGLASDYSEED